MVVRNCYFSENYCYSKTVVGWNYPETVLEIARSFVDCPHNSLLPLVVDNTQLDDRRNTFHRRALVDAFVLFGGMLPEDIDYTPHLDYFKSKKMIWMYGTNDPFLTPPRLEFIRTVIFKSQISFTEQTFEGEHKVPREVVKKLFETTFSR